MTQEKRFFTGDKLFFETLDSTNDRMLAMFIDNIPAEGTVIHTEFQTGGRGHMGASWQSERGKNLLFSILLLPDFLVQSRQFELSKIISLALVDIIGKYCKNVLIKWPNDILSGGKKIAGILIENIIIGNKICRSVAGIGLNVNQDHFSIEIPNPTSMLLETGCQFDMTELLDQVIERIEFWYNVLYREEYEMIDRAYARNLYGFNEIIEFKRDNRKFMASIAGIEQTGEIVLELEDGEKKKFGFKEITFM